MKTLLVTLIFIFFLNGTAVAEIYSEYDSFSKKTKIYSSLSGKKNPIKGVISQHMLLKISDSPDIITYFAVVDSDFENPYLPQTGWWFFSNAPLQIKIDDEVYDIKNITTRSNIIQGIVLRTISCYLVPPEIFEKFRGAKNVVIRYRFTNRPVQDIVIPDKALTEWVAFFNTSI